MRPIMFDWDGETMRPRGRAKQLADAQYVVGESYLMEPLDSRSDQDHKHYFAWLAEAWANLPERYAGLWANPERLRKWALIQTGFCDTLVHRARTRKDAERFMAEMIEYDEEVMIERVRTRVIVKRAFSQSYINQSKRRFRESKKAVINVVSALIGVSPETLKQETGHHA